MSPQDQHILTRLTMVAKKIVYDPARFKVFLQMLGTQHGALTAVHTVLAAISHHTQIPPELVGQLGVNTYLVMVDVAQQTTHHKADPKIVHEVVQQIMAQSGQGGPVGGADGSAQATPAPQPPAAPQGILGSQMGAQ